MRPGLLADDQFLHFHELILQHAREAGVLVGADKAGDEVLGHFEALGQFGVGREGDAEDGDGAALAALLLGVLRKSRWPYRLM